MQIDVTVQNGMLVARVREPRIDAAAAIRFKERMREVVQAPGRRVILDLAEVQFLDSSGLGAIVAVMRLLAPDRTLEIAALTPPVRRVFHLTRLDSVLTLHPQVPDDLSDAG